MSKVGNPKINSPHRFLLSFIEIGIQKAPVNPFGHVRHRPKKGLKGL
jgi:hypothetical protein